MIKITIQAIMLGIIFRKEIVQLAVYFKSRREANATDKPREV